MNDEALFGEMTKDLNSCREERILAGDSSDYDDNDVLFSNADLTPTSSDSGSDDDSESDIEELLSPNSIM